MFKKVFYILLCLVLGHFQSIAFAEDFENPFLKFSIDSVSQNDLQNRNKDYEIVQPGNGRLLNIPEFPTFTQMRLGLSLNGFALSDKGRTDLAIKLGSEKIPQIMQALDNQGLLQEAVRLAKIFQIDPLDILGPIIGENSFNGFIDRTIQDSYHKMIQQSDIEKMSEKMSQITNNAEAQKCLNSNITNYWKWRCVIFYSANSVNNSNGDLIRGFYSFSGPKSGTFGIGQIQPFLLWSLNDIVASKTKYEKFELNNLDKPMHIIFNNKEMLAYIAANTVVSIQVYKIVAGVDISKNSGLTTTLYNLGDEYKRAYNLKLQKNYSAGALPQVNYMGWYINTFDQKIRSYLKKYEQNK